MKIIITKEEILKLAKKLKNPDSLIEVVQIEAEVDIQIK